MNNDTDTTGNNRYEHDRSFKWNMLAGFFYGLGEGFVIALFSIFFD